MGDAAEAMRKVIAQAGGALKIWMREFFEQARQLQI